MELMLKKTKITSSILKQSLRSTGHDFLNGEVLGWCVFNGSKYIVCYRSSSCNVSIFPMFKEAKKTSTPKDGSNMEYRIEVKLGGRYVSLMYYNTNESDADEFIELLNKVKNLAESAGQFYI